MQRRHFLASVAAGALAPRSSYAAQGDIRVFLNEPIGTVSPLLHGHFVEHLGGVVYDGIWVGEESKIPNVRGLRKSLIDAMKALGPTVIRYPGGCFADSYDWRDGVGPRNTRPRKNNFWANSGILRKLPDNHVSRSDPNAFGTNEFLRLLQRDRQRAVPGGQRAQPAGAGFLRLGGVLQFAEGRGDTGRTARGMGRSGAVECALLGRGQ
ncbi:MAG: hypothetical protein IPJ98_30665 [Bryobacterales bacterium]|nr:hypothetical protein [Bryobacterales bacterium]